MNRSNNDILRFAAHGIRGLLGFGVAVGLSGCATTSRDWERATGQGTVAAYEAFLQKHPAGERSRQAERLLPELRTEEAWGQAKASDTISAYEQYLSRHPQSKHAKQASESIDALRYRQAKATDTAVAYQSYLERQPAGAGVPDAQKRLRELRFAEAQQQMTLPAFESFLKQYSEGADVDTLKAALPGVRALERSRALGTAILAHAPQTTMTLNNFQVTGGNTVRSEPTAADLARMKTMLADGADPNAVRVAEFELPGKRELAPGVVLHSTGNPGRIARAEEGGLTLLEYCRLNGLKTISALLSEHGAK